jgi:hypothetical protein
MPDCPFIRLKQLPRLALRAVSRDHTTEKPADEMAISGSEPGREQQLVIHQCSATAATQRWALH